MAAAASAAGRAARASPVLGACGSAGAAASSVSGAASGAVSAGSSAAGSVSSAAGSSAGAGTLEMMIYHVKGGHVRFVLDGQNSVYGGGSAGGNAALFGSCHNAVGGKISVEIKSGGNRVAPRRCKADFNGIFAVFGKLELIGDHAVEAVFKHVVAVAVRLLLRNVGADKRPCGRLSRRGLGARKAPQAS